MRLHACREPLPREAYIKQAEALKSKNLSLRQMAAILGVAKSTLHDWLKKEPAEDEDFETSSPFKRKQCGLCGKWILKGATPIWFHATCHDKVVTLLEEAKSGISCPKPDTTS